MSNPNWIQCHAIEVMESLLREADVIAAKERVLEARSAGEGNMNVALRVSIGSPEETTRTLIMKQSRPFVAKYETIAAPSQRIHYESAFYQWVARFPDLASQMPGCLAWMPEHDLLILEDLGEAADATQLYAAMPDAIPTWLPSLLGWLAALHQQSAGLEPEPFANRELRALNHQHIFEIPFSDPAVIDLDGVCPGLDAATRKIRTDLSVRESARGLGQIYLADALPDTSTGEVAGETCLLHGDFYPGSWLLTENGPYVIDPEFCFVGRPEFDLGVLLAHLWMGHLQHVSSEQLTATYSPEKHLDHDLIVQFASIEVLRRILGVAQLPLGLNLRQRTDLVERAAELLR